MKALIVDEPWIMAILKGDKTWEMRKKNCDIRGQVVGTANVVDSRAPLATRGDYAVAEQHHRIPPARQEEAVTDGWRTPWVLANARPLQKPVRYRPPSGAVIWVNLDPDVTALAQAQVSA